MLDVAGLVRGDAVLSGVRVHATDPTPLPARFRLSKTGRPVPVTNSGGAATGAGGGRGCGPVHLRDVRPPPDGAVLVTATLDPALAADLPRLAGLVAETGNVLSHRGTDG